MPAIPAIVGFVSTYGAAIGAVAAVGSAAMQARASSKQAAAQRAAQAAQSRAANVEAQQARIAQVREARIRRAQVIASGSNAGMGGGTSGISGAVGSITSQMGANIGNINQQQTFAQETSTALQTAADYGVKAQQWQQIGNFSQSIFGQAGGMTTIFGGNTSKKAGT